MTLYEFVRRASHDERLAESALAIPADVTSVRVCEHATGMELELQLAAPILDDAALLNMERCLKNVLHVSHVRMYIRNLDGEYGPLSMPAVWNWICWVMKQKTHGGIYVDAISSSEEEIRILLHEEISDEDKEEIRVFHIV